MRCRNFFSVLNWFSRCLCIDKAAQCNTETPVVETLPVHCNRKKKFGCGGCFDWTKEKITETADSDTRFNGFSGETCGNCKREVNVPADGPGWFCCCGAYNYQSWSYHQTPHENPDLGPTRVVIQQGIQRSKAAIKQRQWQQEFERKYGKH